MVLLGSLCSFSLPAWGLDCKQALTKWDLWTHGNCLRGANLWQARNDKSEFGNALGEGAVGPPFSIDILRRLRSWGGNLVMLSHPGIFSEKAPYLMEAKVQANLDEMVHKAGAAGLYTVISFRTGPGRSEKAFSPPPGPESGRQIWTSRAAQDAWVRMWKHVAQRYRNHPHVVGYNLMVEPNPNTTAVKEHNPEAFAKKYGGSLYDWYPLAQRIVQAIRSVDRLTPILVSPMNYGDLGWLSAMPLMRDGRTVYIVHQYEPYLYTHQTEPFSYFYPGFFDGNWDGVPETIDRGWLRGIFTPLESFRNSHKVPLAVMEYGLKHRVPDSAKFLSDELEIFETLQLSHALWLWETDYSGVDWDDFNVRAASDPVFLDTLKKNWQRNVNFP